MDAALTRTERVVESLNSAIHKLFEDDPQVYLIGEDLLDPYGGAFKVALGLSSAYPDRVLTTPISEAAILGVAGGLALCGEKPIVEIMFGDFIALGFDQILNFATKSVSMYGQTLPLNLVVRCPTGGGRSYGPTHSQSLQKHFIGIPNLSLFELSPLHDTATLLRRLVDLGHPCILFEDKVLYTQRMYRDGYIDGLFSFDFLDTERSVARVFLNDFDDATCVLIAPGGMFHRCLSAAQAAFLDFEIGTQIIVPSRLYPFDLDPIIGLLERADFIMIAEESVAGGTWGSEVAHQIYDRLWGRLKHKVRLLYSKNSIIPSAAHLEKQVLLQTEEIYQAIKESAHV